MVFNFPEGDTVVLDDPTANYYDILRQYQLRYGPDRGREALLQQHEIITRPVDKRENYIKRAVALPGDTLQVIHSDVFVNGQPQSRIPNKQYVYFIRTDGTMINPQALEDMGIAQADINYDAAERTYIMPLTEDNLARISKMRNVTDVVKYEAEGVDPNVFFRKVPVLIPGMRITSTAVDPLERGYCTTDRRKPAALSPHHRNLRRQ